MYLVTMEKGGVGASEGCETSSRPTDALTVGGPSTRFTRVSFGRDWLSNGSETSTRWFRTCAVLPSKSLSLPWLEAIP